MAREVQYVCYIDETGFYLGDAERLHAVFGMEFQGAASTWVPASPDGSLTLIRTRDVQTLWKSLGLLGERYKQLNNVKDMDQTVHLFMPCGAMARYVAFDDLPWQSLPCQCGNPEHWLIRYTAEDELF